MRAACRLVHHKLTAAYSLHAVTGIISCSRTRPATLQHGGQQMTTLHDGVTEFGRAFLKMAGHRVNAWRRHWSAVDSILAVIESDKALFLLLSMRTTTRLE